MIGKHLDGGYAEFIKVPGRNVFALPDEIPFEIGAIMRQAVLCLGPLGRAALVGLTAETMSILPYTELINKEAEIIGVSDHLAAELPMLIEFARNGKLRFPSDALRFVGLNGEQINAALEAFQDSIEHVRTVIKTGF